MVDAHGTSIDRRRSLVKDMLGERFTRLTVVARAGSTKGGTARWQCVCDCGTVKIVDGAALRNQAIKSCGCLNRELTTARSTKHGLCRMKAYHAWSAMRGRCENPRDAGYKDYGGRGIKICERWQDVRNFVADMGEPPPGMEIDRYPDKNGNYEPGNCRWATKLQNMENRRNSRIITFRGERMSIGAAARLAGVHRASLRKCILRGESPETAVARLPQHPG